MVGSDELDSSGQTREQHEPVAAWMTSVTGSFRGQLQAAPWREQQEPGGELRTRPSF